VEGTGPSIVVNGAALIPDRSGAIFWPDKHLLIVADMHLEKGSAFARHGQMLPPYDSAITLTRLAQQIAHYKPEGIVMLGDSFHDVRASDRMDVLYRTRLLDMINGLNLIWITGNHDPHIPNDLPGSRHAELVVGPLLFRHEPLEKPDKGEIAGHLHPVAKVVTSKGKLRDKAFVSDGSRLIMPAFGAFTGGLNLRDPAIDSLFQSRKFNVHVCGRTRVYPVPQNRLFGD
jgi:uncharacterized protein